MAKYTRQDILDLIEEEDVKFIRLQFTDIAGNLKNMATTVDQIDKILGGRCRFNCAAVAGSICIARFFIPFSPVLKITYYVQYGAYTRPAAPWPAGQSTP